MLFHDFVNSCAITVIHLIKLVNATDAIVGKNEGTTFENHFIRYRISHDGSSKTNARGSAARCVDTARCNFGNVFEELGFSDTRVAHEAHVDVTTNPHAVTHFFRDTADEEKEKALLNIEVAEDFGSNGAGKMIIEVAGLTESSDPLEGLFIHADVIVLFLVLIHILSFEIGVGEQTGADGAETSVGDREEDATQVDDITRSDRAGEGAVKMDRESPRDMAHRNLFCKFLNFDFLKRKKLGCTGRHKKLAFGLVLLTFRRWTFKQGRKCLGLDLLEDFTSATVTSVGINEDGRLDVGNSGSNTAHSDEMP